MERSSSERERLRALLAALEDPADAGKLPAEDPALVAAARHHRLSPLLSATTGDTLPAQLGEIFRRDRLVTAARNMILGQVAEECARAFGAAGIRTIMLKGVDYENRLYRAPGARPMSDVDLLIPNGDRRAAFGVLDRLGFEPRAAAPGFDDADYHEVAWTRQGLEVDLHMALAPFARCRIDYRAVWAEARPLRIGQTDAWALAPAHAAIFHALHMAIDHFGVPAIYLIDLARLLPTNDELGAAQQTARLWHCHRPLTTALAIAGAFLPRWASHLALPTPSPGAARIAARFGPAIPLPRAEQLYRKFAHFDAAGDALRYFVVQSRRNLREWVERDVRKRSARERLALQRP